MSDKTAGLLIVKATDQKVGDQAKERTAPDAPDEQARDRALLSQPGQLEHTVQFYEKEERLYEAVIDFTSAGLAAGEPVILVATEAHRKAVVRRLMLNGCQIETKGAGGQLTLLDARELLSRFMVGDGPDWANFRLIVGGLIEKSRAGRPDVRVRVYGEMVDLLAGEGNEQAAIRLEELWNDLAKLHPFSLLCSYAAANLCKARDGNLLDKLCRVHNNVVPTLSFSPTEEHVRSVEKELEDSKQMELSLREALKQRIGALVQADDARWIVEEESEQGEERFKLLIESVKDYAIFMLDPEGRIISWNIGAERMKGYRAEEIIGHHFSRFYPEEDVRGGKCDYELEVAARDGRFEDENWRVKKDGTRFWANVIISRMVNRTGQLIGFAKVTRDLTQRRALEDERIARATAEAEGRRLALEREALERALSEQKQIEVLRERLLGVVGHDLRSPLNSITMSAALMLKRGTLQDSDGKAVARIARSADRMSEIISQLLDFTRARLGGGIPIDPKLIDLADVCGDVIAECETAHPDRALRFDADIDTTGVWDRNRVAQVVANLIGNAIQHGKPDGPIDVRLRDEGEVVCLSVHNDGPPIPPDLLPAIFDPFRGRTAHQARRGEGLGLGLFIVREMIRAHSGEIDVQSTEADGTTFLVKLPRKPASTGR